MDDKFDVYLQIAEYYNDGIIIDELQNIREKQENPNIYVPIIGQFSSGKSSFINHILERRILPTMLSETTAFTTFLHYTEDEEYAEIITEQHRYTVELSDLLKLSQANLKEDESIGEILSIAGLKSSDVVQINAYINNPLLSNGLILIDTPGLNTLVAPHETRTKSIVPQADLILYVIGKSISDTDIKLYESLKKIGVECIFIRTKLDMIRKTEGETPDTVMEHDIKVLNDKISTPIKYFGVSNELELAKDSYWEGLSQKIRDYFIDNIIFDKNEIKKMAMEIQLKDIKKQLISTIENNLNQLQSTYHLSISDIENEIKALESNILTVNEKININNQKLATKKEGLSHKVNNIIEQEFEILLDSYKKNVRANNNKDGLSSINQQFQQKIIGNSIEKINREIQDCLQTFLKQTAQETNSELELLNTDLITTNIIELDLTVEEPQVHDVFKKGDMIQTRVQNLADEINSKIERLEYEEAELKRNRSQAQQDIELGEIQRAETKYNPEYEIHAPNTNANALKGVGKLVDVGTLFIPTGAAAGLLKRAGKVAQAGKLAKTAKVLKSAKAMKVAETIDRVHKTSLSIKNGQDVRLDSGKVSLMDINHQLEKNTNFNLLDALSAEYWFEKIGESLDGPPRKIENIELKNEYIAEVNRINQKIDHARRLEIEAKSKLRQIEDEKQRLKDKMELDRHYAKIRKEEEKKAEERHRKLQEEKYIKDYQDSLIKKLEIEITTAKNKYITYINNYINDFFEKLPMMLTVELEKKLYIMKENLKKQIELKKEDEQTQQSHIDKIIKFKKLIEEIE
ncbi:dynamin family protein [Macrococcoides canis]|uniref:dynamin family protein n=1 Tax=Macrococcoides canis TaxID=1855823 RepID=UPI00165E5490|nr:dynamin family protein [Macrococcus canis]QNR07163.1 hypothetical protein GL258_02495 [Macrococcus canis]